MAGSEEQPQKPELESCCSISTPTFTSTVESYLNLFKLEQYLGIFPFKLEYNNDKSQKFHFRDRSGSYAPKYENNDNSRGHTEMAEGHGLRRIDYHKTGKWAWLNRFLISFASVLFVWEMSALIVNLHYRPENLAIFGSFTILIQVTWIYSGGFQAGILITFALKRQQICELLNQWMTLDWEIIKHGESERVTKSMTSQSRFRLVLLGVYGLMPVLSTLFLVVMFLTQPNPVMSSHQLMATIIPSKVASSVIFGVFMNVSALVIWIVIASMEVLVLSLCHSVRHSLRVLRPHAGGSDHKVFEWSVTNYKRLEGLVTRFNRAFAWFLLLYKGAVFFLLLLVISIGLSFYRDLSGLPFLAGLCISLVFRFTCILMSMGAVREESVRYRKAWLETAFTFTRLRARPVDSGTDPDTVGLTRDQREMMIWTVHPIEFRVGNFYSIVPSSILTFGWIFETYIIVVLQLLYEK